MRSLVLYSIFFSPKEVLMNVLPSFRFSLLVCLPENAFFSKSPFRLDRTQQHKRVRIAGQVGNENEEARKQCRWLAL